MFNVSKIKRQKGGAVEIEFFDRMKALEKLLELSCAKEGDSAGFYKALEEGVKNAGRLFGGEENEQS